MGVYIKGMEMPNNCQECVCINDEYFYCQAVGRQPQDENIISQRPDWCPLVEVPTHGRIIDADALADNWYYASAALRPDDVKKVVALDNIDRAPTIIEAEE